MDCCLITGVVGILAAIAIPNFKKAGGMAREKACYANMRILLGAIEMYNMDAKGPPDEPLIDGFKFEEYDSLVEILVDKNYLKSILSRPETKCNYIGKDILKGGVIRCKIHDSVD